MTQNKNVHVLKCWHIQKVFEQAKPTNIPQVINIYPVGWWKFNNFQVLIFIFYVLLSHFWWKKIK